MSAIDPIRQAAQERLDLHLPMLRAYARHLVADPADADDVAQDVCLEVLATPAILMRGDDPGAYLRGIARHLTHRHRRRFRRHQTLEELIDLTWSEEPDHGPDREAEATALADCLERLHQRLRAMLELRYREGLNASEIGTRFTISAEAVRMSLSRGRQALGRCLALRRMAAV